LPVVCGVGHETDITLCDLAADLRAPTPTAAAELAAPPREALLRELDGWAQALRDRVHRRLDQQAQRLDRAAMRLARPTAGLARQAMRLQSLQQRLQAGVARRLSVAPERLERLAQRHHSALTAQLARQQHALARAGERLAALAPQRTLARGFAYLSDDRGQPLTRAQQLHPQQAVRAQLADGEVALRVEAVSLPLLGPDVAP
jgi:exodeoxyribonuclease VII large subunit